MAETKKEKTDGTQDVFNKSVALQIEKLLRRDGISAHQQVVRRLNNESVFDRCVKMQNPLTPREVKNGG
jgi:hypothetical protein